MMQAEKALRDAGWIEVPLSEVRAGDELYDLERHEIYTARVDGKLISVGRALRAPHPEPEYKPGTVVWGLVGENTAGPQALIWQDDDEFPWVGVSRLCYTQGAWRDSAVKVLRVLAYPGGYTPTYQTESQRNALIEGMVPRVARALQKGDHCRDCDWVHEDEAWRAMYERVARHTLREAYEEATK